MHQVTFIDGCFGQIPESSRLYHVANGETLDGLVFGGASTTIKATDIYDVSAALLSASVIATFNGLRRVLASVKKGKS